MDAETNKVHQKVKRELADFLGIGMEDIEDESEFETDFHMSATEMTDFVDILSKSGFSVDQLSLTEIESFSDLIDQLTAHS